ncbi:MAG: phosphate ABC transporter permease PstA [Limnothrix sp.]|nr:phosphate ABC transporter permease PstA [Limnothrix sp.]RFP58190.1 MAG: phosphate ABC transporter permease PstA [Limnothrix sp. CACIAM 69d]
MLAAKFSDLITPQLGHQLHQRKLLNLGFMVMGLVAIMVALFTLAALIIHMAMSGWPRLSTWEFFTAFASRRPERAGILAAWVGSLLVISVTAIVAVPIGVAAGIYLEEYARKNWLSELIEINVTNLAGVPSIIYGLLALGVFVYEFKFGRSVLTAGCTLALLILPIVIVTTRESLRSIPQMIREAAYAVGATQWQVIWHHVLPYSIGGILTGTIIGLSRAIGETSSLITIGALTFIAFLPESPFQGKPPFVSWEWLNSPFTVMPIQMFNWVSRPNPEFQVNAAAAGTVLMTMTLLMNGFAIYLRYRLRQGIKW